MKIAIKFGDNDFHSTWFPIMETLKSAYDYNGELPQTKEELLIIINNLSCGFYLAFQNQFKYNDEKNLEISHTKKYLILTEEELLLNDEVDNYLKSLEPFGGIDNSSTFILDTELYNNNVYVI